MNPNLNAFLSAVRSLLIVLGAVMAREGYEHTTYYSDVMMASGSIMVVGPAVWAVISSIRNWWKAAAVGAQSGMNMALAGKALAADGVTPVSNISEETTPTKPVTIATTKEIVKDFAPADPIAKV